MSEVTRILSAIEQGDPSAAEQLLPLIYDELRKLAAQRLAQEKPGQTLQATAALPQNPGESPFVAWEGCVSVCATNRRSPFIGKWLVIEDSLHR